MASNRDATDQLLRTFGPPVKGVWRTLAAHQLPPDALYDASNVMVRDGACYPRPGHAAYVATALPEPPMGGIDYISAAGVRTLLIGTSTKFYSLSGTSWVDITGGVTWSSSSDQHIRFTTLEYGTPSTVYAIACNRFNTPVQHDSTSGAFSTVAGSPPIFSDITTAFDRVVGIIPPYAVMWGEAQDLATWPAVNRRNLSDTEDVLKAIKNLGTMGLAVYKEKSIFVGQVQGGPSSSAFAFRPAIIGVDGPPGPAAVVNANGVHYYMTPTGRLGRFDGSGHRWVADGCWPHTRALVDSQYMGRTHGVYDQALQTVTFYYPGTGDGGHPCHMLTLCLPFPEVGIPDFAAFPGVVSTLAVRPYASLVARNSINQDLPLILDHLGPKAYYLNTTTQTDNGLAFSGYVQSGLAPAPEMEPHAASVEPFMLRGTGYGTCTFQVLSSYVLEAAGGTPGDSFTLDLTATPRREQRAFDTRGRFFGLKGSFTMPTTWAYFGGNLYVRSLGRGPTTNP